MRREAPAHEETLEAGSAGPTRGWGGGWEVSPPVQRTPYAPRTLDLPLRGTGEWGDLAKVHQETHPPSPPVLP